MPRATSSRWVLAGVVSVAVVSAAIALRGRPVSAQAAQTVTFTKDVAPILQQKCQVCHQPNSIAPMSLLTYDDAKTVRASDQERRSSARLMPPWYMDKTVGIQHFKNDRSLSDARDRHDRPLGRSGRADGRPKDMPPPVTFPDQGGWQFAKLYGQPDLVLKSPPYTLAAHTQDKWFRPVTDTGVTEPRWVRAIEIRPATLRGPPHRASRADDARAARGGRHHGPRRERARHADDRGPVHGVGRRQDRRDLQHGRRQADAAGIEDPLGNPHVRHRRRGEGQPDRARRLLLPERHRARSTAPCSACST